MAWPKGLKELFDLMKMMSKRSGSSFQIDLYGNGPHLKEIEDAAKFMKLPVSLFELSLFVGKIVNFRCSALIGSILWSKRSFIA